MRVVLDTNILVSGLLTPFSPSGEILRMLPAGMLVALLDARILWEYREVLERPKFPFRKEAVEGLLDEIEGAGEAVTSGPLPKRLPDPDDEAFLEVALAGKADCLVTGNLRDYPERAREGMRVVSPAEILEFVRKSP